MCTFTQFRRSGNARAVNCGWTGGDLARGRSFLKARARALSIDGSPLGAVDWS
jgi:hypothetical protein